MRAGHSGALPCAGLPAVIVSSAVSPKLSQLPAAHRIPAARRWPICTLYAARVRWPAARSLPA
jgi:hypothetical protein